MLIKSTDKFEYINSEGITTFVGSLGLYLDLIASDATLQGPMGLQGVQGPPLFEQLNMFKATGINSPEPLPADTWVKIDWATLTINQGENGYSLQDDEQVIDMDSQLGIWVYTMQAKTTIPSKLDIEMRYTSGDRVASTTNQNGEVSMTIPMLHLDTSGDPIEMRIRCDRVASLSQLVEDTSFTAYHALPLPETPTVPIVIERDVSSGLNNAHQLADGNSFSHSVTNLKCDPNTNDALRWNCATKFNNVTIPPGATITDAWVSVVFRTSNRDSPRLRIYGELVDNSLNYSVNATVNGRAKTAAFAPWSGDDLGGTGRVQSPSLSSTIQEVVNQAGWVSGNNISLIFWADSVIGPEEVWFTPYDFDPADVPRLHVEYTEP